MEHELKYRVGSSGLALAGIPDNSQPHWYCTCGTWRKDRNLRGQPFEETARKHHRKHIQEFELVARYEGLVIALRDLVRDHFNTEGIIHQSSFIHVQREAMWMNALRVITEWDKP